MVRRIVKPKRDMFVPEGWKLKAGQFGLKSGGTLAVRSDRRPTSRVIKYNLKPLGKGAFATAFVTTGRKTPIVFSFVESGADQSKEIFSDLCTEVRSKHLPCMEKFGWYTKFRHKTWRQQYYRHLEDARKAFIKFLKSKSGTEEAGAHSSEMEKQTALANRIAGLYGELYEVFTMPLYNKITKYNPRSLVREQAYALQDCLMAAWGQLARRHPDTSGPGRDRMFRELKSKRVAVIECAKRKTLPGSRKKLFPPSLIRALRLINDAAENWSETIAFEFPEANLMVDNKGNLILLDVIYDIRKLRGR